MASIKKLETQVKRLKSRCKKLEYLAYHDPLTGIQNRRAFTKFINSKISRNKQSSFCLAFIDINKFKKYNDENGHLAGDQLLISLVKKIQRLTNKNDRLFRFAGDEFILVTNKTGQKCKKYIKNIQKEISSALPVSISMGLSEYPSDSNKIQILIQKADDCMYKAKNIVSIN